MSRRLKISASFPGSLTKGVPPEFPNKFQNTNGNGILPGVSSYGKLMKQSSSNFEGNNFNNEVSSDLSLTNQSLKINQYKKNIRSSEKPEFKLIN